MREFLESCVSRYLELAGVTKLRNVATPYLPEEPKFSDARRPHGPSSGISCPWCKCTFSKEAADSPQYQLGDVIGATPEEVAEYTRESGDQPHADATAEFLQAFIDDDDDPFLRHGSKGGG